MAAILVEGTCTFLSANVNALIQETCTCGTLDEAKTTFKLPLVISNTGCPTEQWTAVDYQRAIQLMGSTIQQISHQLSASEDLDDGLYEFLQWTRNEKLFKDIYSLLRHPKHSTSVPQGILLCTAALERALGNVYLLLNSQVPSLMKDLLSSMELQQIFGTENMSLLQLIIGPPTSLNIRNILWHGFAAPEEIPIHLGLFLFALVLNLGYTLNNKGIALESLPFRTEAKFNHMDFLCGVFPDIHEAEHFEILEQLFLESRFIPNIMRPYWQDSLRNFRWNRYGACLALLLPQMEHSLRCLFTFANNCPERMLTAESASFYTTFDEILAPCLPNGEINKIKEDLDENYLSALFDVLVYPDGPRARDRCSHGEIDFLKIPRELATHILGLCAAFCIKFLPHSHPLTENHFLRCIETSIQNYKPLYHPSAIVIHLIQNLIEECLHWSLHSDTEQQKNDVIEAIYTATTVNLPCNWQDLLKKLLLGDNLDGILNELKSALSAIRCKTLYRPKLEWEALLQMKRILRNSFEASRQIQLFIVERSEMIVRHQLRSRQRATYHRMLTSIPTFKTGLLVIGATMCISLSDVNILSELDSKEREKRNRFLKSMEKTSENLKTLTDHTKNRWDESKEIILHRLYPDILKQYQNES